MKIITLKLENFRNHPKFQLHLRPDEPLTCIVGQNAQGKTNILEAIFTLALSKSFRTSTSEDLIGWDQEYARIQGEIQQESSQKCELEVFFGHPPQPKKSLKKNGVKVTAQNFIGNFKVVLFHPEDLNMLYLGPDLRRKFLDMLNLQMSKSYYTSLSEYKKVLQQRNALLKAIKKGVAHKDELFIWNEPLVEHGLILMIERAKTVDFFHTHVSEYYQKIADSNDEVNVEYQHMFAIKEDTFSGDFSGPLPLLDPKTLEQKYLQALENSFHKDISAEYTTIGPHRDDLVFRLNGRPLQTSASRGEYRSLLLALKLLEMLCLQEKTAEKPVLLLDDVFSELDFSRQEMLLKAIQEHQAIIATTHLDDVKIGEKGKIFRIEELKK